MHAFVTFVTLNIMATAFTIIVSSVSMTWTSSTPCLRWHTAVHAAVDETAAKLKPWANSAVARGPIKDALSSVGAEAAGAGRGPGRGGRRDCAGHILGFTFSGSRVMLQERKLLVPVADLGEADGAIALAMAAGLNWAAAAEGVYQDLGWAVDTPETWAAYMRLAGGRCDEHRVVTLQVGCHSHLPGYPTCVAAVLRHVISLAGIMHACTGTKPAFMVAGRQEHAGDALSQLDISSSVSEW